MSVVASTSQKPVPTQSVLSLLVFVGGLSVIGSALAFEHIGGYIPCALCLQQRYAYYAAVPAALLVFVLKQVRAAAVFARLLLVAIAFGYLANAALGGYHAGAEWGFWPGPDSCATGGGTLASDTQSLLSSLSSERPPSCTEASLRVLGLSFAGWNVLASLMLAGLAGACAFWPQRAQNA